MLADDLDVLLVEADPLEAELLLRPLAELAPAERIGVARDGEEALDYLLGAIASMPGVWQIEVLLKLPMEEARTRVPADVAVLEQEPDGVMLRTYSDTLEWMARFLVGLRCPLVVYQPPQLREALRQLAQSIFEMAEAPPQVINQ
jgi:predicted DNA-binding transcriptional regulator YafY